MAFSGTTRKVPGGVHWEVDLPSSLTDWSYWTHGFECGPIKCAINLTNMLVSRCDVCVRFVIVEVPGRATFSRLLRWQMDVKGSAAQTGYSSWTGDLDGGDEHGLPCIMNGEKRVTGGYLGVAQQVFLERTELECQQSPRTRLTFHLRVKVEGVDTDMQFPTETESHRSDKKQVSCNDQSQDGNDSSLSNQDVQALLTLQKDFKELRLSGDDQDVVIKIDNREFRAHRNVLRARSPVFAAMFRSEMKESAGGSITIEDCDPDAFDEFLEYVYTGKVQNLSTENAMGLYYAGDKYDFPGLKETCVEFLKTSLSTTTVSKVISVAVKHDEQELLESAMAFFAGHLEEIMATVEWQHFVLANPIQANEICLKAVKNRLHKN